MDEVNPNIAKAGEKRFKPLIEPAVVFLIPPKRYLINNIFSTLKYFRHVFYATVG
jgi:hypothetical protein